MTTPQLRVLASLDFPPAQPFTAADAARAGVTRGRLRAALRSGSIRSPFPDVYVPADWPDDHSGRVAAVLHVMPSHAVAVDRTAAWLHGIDVFDYPEQVVLPRLEIASVGGPRASVRAGVFGCQRALVKDELTVADGVRTTTPLRTAADIACLRGRHRAIAVLDAFRTSFGLRPADLRRQAVRFRGRRGVTQLRELIPLSRVGAESPPESWLRLDLHDAGFPMPRTQVTVTVPGWGEVRMENAYPALRLAVEYDSDLHHSAVEERTRDQERRRALEDELGWHVVVVRKEGLSARGRDEWLREFGQLFADRAPEALRKRIYARDPNTIRFTRGR